MVGMARITHLGVIVARACGTDLKSYAQEHLFSPMNAEVGDWYHDADNYRFGSMGIFVTARDMAKFGMLYLNGGEYEGKQVLSAEWVRESLQRYSEGMNFSGWIPGITSYYGSFHGLGYGYSGGPPR
jgi:CubicO group peptidase (beta-lactamase class C family)